ncbi:MAG TPA: ATP-dependent DNA helicase [Terriglobales bacterium]|nr:ATP-dependent DNA helicase [Terriglobales bacterium]
MVVSKSSKTLRTFVADERQTLAIEHIHGPMLVIAGAGTGKTTVLTRRIARLIREQYARPDEVIAVTYTDNSAKEMRERVLAELQGADSKGPQVCTFHAYCNNLLIRSGKKFGVLDDKDLWIYLRKRLRELNLKYFVKAANVSKFLDDLLDFMRRCQDELVGPEKYAEYVQRLERGDIPVPRVGKSKDAALLTDEEIIGRCREISNVFTTVERMLEEENLGTFGHMISRAYDLLEHDADLLAQERQRARFSLIDEFQDANFAQIKILQKIAGEEQNIFAVGDPDQAIYRFRGASSAAFEIFHRNFPTARTVVLDRNRRSISSVLNCAFAVITSNPEIFTGTSSVFQYRRSPLTSGREEDALREGKKLSSAPVETVILTAKDAECFDVVTAIRQKQRQNRSLWKDFAILYRQHSHRDQLASELAQQGIPFTIENMDVMDTPEVRDLFACLGAVFAPNDGASLFRIAALPQFNIDPEKLRAGMRAVSRTERNSSMMSVLDQIEGGPDLLQTLAKTQQEIRTGGAKSLAALKIILRNFGFDASSQPIQAVLDFVSRWEEKAITKTKEIAELIEYLDYFREARGAICMPSNEENAVRLITAHAAKGLEFDHVFILRAASPSFPASYKESLVEFPRELRDKDSLGTEDNKIQNEQEERRLFYVAMTRARDSLTIYAPEGRGKTDKTPPGFLRDLLKNAALRSWLRQRPPHGFQTDLFGAAASAPITGSRMSEWVNRPPVSNLGARLSASAVQRYDVCPLQFKLEREWNIPGEVPAAFQYGATMHRILKAYYDSVRAERPLSEEKLIELLQNDLAEAGIDDPYQHELYEKQGKEQIRGLLEACRRSPVPQVLHTEEGFEIKIAGTTVVGRIDRIDRLPDGRVVITDYKTGKPQSQDDADESLQLSIYAIAAREKWGYVTDHLAFYNLQENSNVITERGGLALKEAELKVQNVADRIAAGDFKATPGFYCNFCAYRNLCPATEKRIYTIAAIQKAGSSN